MTKTFSSLLVNNLGRGETTPDQSFSLPPLSSFQLSRSLPFFSEITRVDLKTLYG